MTVIEIEHISTPPDYEGAVRRMTDRTVITRELAGVLNEAARLGAQSAQIYAPEGASHKLRRHIAWTHAHPAIGTRGEELEASAGVERIEDEDDPERGKYPDIGTGLFGPRHSWVVPLTGRFMVFEINGQKFVLRRVKGQEPQHFVRDAYRDLLEYLPQRLAAMARSIVQGH